MKWNGEEEKKLVEIYSVSTNDRLLCEFPERTFLSIYKKARSLGLHRSAEIETSNRVAGRNRTATHRPEFVTNKGYKMIYRPLHDRADRHGYVFEHIYVWEKANGSSVPDGYCVHHINKNKLDNRAENLLLLTKSEHTIMHNSERTLSEFSKQKISTKAKERYQNKNNHPRHKSINMADMINEVVAGKTVTQVCYENGINKTTYYARIKKGDI